MLERRKRQVPTEQTIDLAHRIQPRQCSEACCIIVRRSQPARRLDQVEAGQKAIAFNQMISHEVEKIRPLLAREISYRTAKEAQHDGSLLAEVWNALYSAEY